MVLFPRNTLLLSFLTLVPIPPCQTLSLLSSAVGASRSALPSLKAVKPELEVNHFIMTTATGVDQIPALLRGEKNVPSNSALGSKDYDRGVGAIILGAAYNDQAIRLLRDASQGLKPVPWLRPDTSKPAPRLGPEYGKALVARIKEAVKGLQVKGQMNEDSVVYT